MVRLCTKSIVYNVDETERGDEQIWNNVAEEGKRQLKQGTKPYIRYEIRPEYNPMDLVYRIRRSVCP